ncbi:MAG: FecR domain-containing protein [Mangrovibacterium sp.]
MSTTEEKERLIARYLNGELSESDAEELLSWIQSYSENKKWFIELKDVWDAAKPVSFTETEQLLHFYKRQAAQAKRRTLPSWLSGVAVAAVLLVGLLIGNLLRFDTPVLISQVEAFYVPMGSRSQLILADGTHVHLNSDSRLELANDFSARNRTVSLSGEGYFEVKSDESHPFTVKTEKFDVLVTGTKFNVSSYADDQKISATLAEGRIRLLAQNQQPVLLQPGEKISFDQQTMSPILEKAEVGTELAWVNNNFVFKEIPFPDLVRRLERWYDVKIEYNGNEFTGMKYTGSFRNQETIWQVLDALKLTSPIDYKKINFRKFELKYKPMS